MFGKNSEEAIQTINAWVAVMGTPMKKVPNVNEAYLNVGSINLLDKDSFKVSPNPLGGNELFIELEKENDGIEQIVISDMVGKIVFTKNISILKGKIKYSSILLNPKVECI